jgi:polygalacturonase
MGAVVLFWAPGAVHPDVYKSISAKGEVTYSDTLPANATRIEVLKIRPSRGFQSSKAGSARAANGASQAGAAPVATTGQPGESQQKAETSRTAGASAPPGSGGAGGGGGGTAGHSGVGQAPPQAAAASTEESASPERSKETAGLATAEPSAAPPPPPPAPEYGRYTAEPSRSVQSETASISPRSASTRSCDIVPEPVMVEPIVRVDDFGAKGDGVTDDTQAINAAIQSLDGGGTVVLSPGHIYLKRGTIIVQRTGVRLWGYGATLYATVRDADVAAGKGRSGLAIRLEAPDTAVYGLTILSNLRTRLIGHPNGAGIHLSSDRQQAIDNRIEYAQNGVMATGTNFLIARNVVFRTWSDGIHITHDAMAGRFAEAGRVICNVVRQTGDDMIAVVSYGIGEPLIRNFLIEGNDVAEQYWGRGITVVGGEQVTIRGNTVSHATHGAGILISSEHVWQTAHVRNVLVEDNILREIQTTDPPFNPEGEVRRTNHGAIDVDGQSARQKVTDVLIRRNTIDRVRRDGILIRGNVSNIAVVDNAIRAAGRDAINPATSDNVICQGNTLDDIPVEPGCAGAQPFVVTGSDLRPDQ